MASNELTWRDAVIKVLEKYPDGLHYAQIAEEIAKQQLKHNLGATPAISVNVTLSYSINKEGINSPFERVTSGRYRLKPSEATGKSVAAELVPDEEEAAPGLIKAFGIHWRRNLVDWGGKQPRILGSEQPGSDPVDFGEQWGVYALYDDRDIVYAGRAIKQTLGKRLFDHTRDRLNGRWNRFSWFGVRRVTSDGKLADEKFDASPEALIVTLEALLIETLEPRLNRKRGDEFRALEFLQVEDPRFEEQRLKKLLAEAISRVEKK